MACERKPVPATPLSREVMGTSLALITSGAPGTVRSHSEWLLTAGFPPLLEYITVIPCRGSKNWKKAKREILTVSELKPQNYVTPSVPKCKIELSTSLEETRVVIPCSRCCATCASNTLKASGICIHRSITINNH